MSSDIEPVVVTVLNESPKAFFLHDNDEMGPDAWFPKSQISFETRNLKTGNAIAEIPAWLLKEKGWS